MIGYDFKIKPSKIAELIRRMEELGIFEADIEERFVRSSGPGGQKVNKTSSCVQLKHIPTGIEVKMQRERSQNLNRFLARRLLVDRIERLAGKKTAGGIPLKSERIRERIRKQKAKRRKRRGEAAGIKK